MCESLYLYSTMIVYLRWHLPTEHLARLKTLAWMMTGLLADCEFPTAVWLVMAVIVAVLGVIGTLKPDALAQLLGRMIGKR